MATRVLFEKPCVSVVNSLRASFVLYTFKTVRFVTNKTLFMMAPKKKKEYSYDLREVVIKHFLNGILNVKSLVLIPRSCMIKKYKSTKCIGNINEVGNVKQQHKLI